MQTYNVKLEAKPFQSFRCQLAANSLDIDVEKKLTHELNIQADLKSNFNIGLIIGSSGSGKSSLAREIFGQDIFKIEIDLTKPVLENFDKSLKYEDCVDYLLSVGLSSVPCWLKPINILSNGQQARALAAIELSRSKDIIVIDEWTSVVDRTIAKIMSHSIRKAVKKYNKKIILISCHFDIIEWLDPDWIIDCNDQKFIDRRLLPSEERGRKEQFKFEIRKCSKESWRSFSKYHYLSEKIPPGKSFYFGLFLEDKQIGFQAYSNYVPHSDKKKPMQLHSNRIVIHPDYLGIGIGIKFLNETSKIIKQKGFDVRIKLSSKPLIRSLLNDLKNWKYISSGILYKRSISTLVKKGTLGVTAQQRKNVKTYSFKYIGAG